MNNTTLQMSRSTVAVTFAAGLLLGMAACGNHSGNGANPPDTQAGSHVAADTSAACNKFVSDMSIADFDANGSKLVTRKGITADLAPVTAMLSDLVFDCIVVATMTDQRGTGQTTTAAAKPETRLGDIAAAATAAGFTLFRDRDNIWFLVEGNTTTNIYASVVDSLPEHGPFPGATLQVSIVRRTSNQ